MYLYIFLFQFLSLLSILWSTQFQERYHKKRAPLKDYFIHTTQPGSVCQFGIDSGKLIILLIIIQMYLTHTYITKKDKKSLNTLMYVSITILSIIFISMLSMNSGISNKIHMKKWSRGLFENSIPFFLFQVLSIILMSKYKKD